MSICFRKVLTFCAAAITPALVWGASNVSDTQKQKLQLERLRPSLIDVNINLSRVDSLSSRGSGFLAGRQDWIVTNFHVIERKLHRDADHRLLVFGSKGQRFNAKIIAVDVAADLAVLQSDHPLPGAVLKPYIDPLTKGEKLYAYGKSKGNDFKVSTGSFKKNIADGAVTELIFTGQLEAGMSGGPVMDEQGRLVGVNQSITLDFPYESRLVNALNVQKILLKATQSPYGSSDMAIADMVQQYKDMTSFEVDNITKPNKPKDWLGPFGVLTTDNICDHDLFSLADERFEIYRLKCETSNDDARVGEMRLGSIEVRHYWIISRGGSTWRAAAASKYMMDYLRKEPEPESREQGAWECHFKRHTNTNKLKVDVQTCSRPYLRIPGLFDYRLRAALEVTDHESMVSALEADGIDPQNFDRLMLAWINRFERTQPDVVSKVKR
jgi:serine protease Do